MNLKATLSRAIAKARVEEDAYESYAAIVLDILETYGIKVGDTDADARTQEWIFNLFEESEVAKIKAGDLAIGVISILQNNGFSILERGLLSDDPVTRNLIIAMSEEDIAAAVH